MMRRKAMDENFLFRKQEGDIARPRDGQVLATQRNKMKGRGGREERFSGIQGNHFKKRHSDAREEIEIVRTTVKEREDLGSGEDSEPREGVLLEASKGNAAGRKRDLNRRREVVFNEGENVQGRSCRSNRPLLQFTLQSKGKKL